MRRLRTSFSVCLWFLEYWLYNPVTGYSIVCHRIVMLNSPRGISCLQLLRLLLGGTRSSQKHCIFSICHFQELNLPRQIRVPSSPLAGGAFRCTQTAWRDTASGLNTHWTPPRWRFLAPRGCMLLGVNVFWAAVFGRFECSTCHVDLNKKYEKQVDFKSTGDWSKLRMHAMQVSPEPLLCVNAELEEHSMIDAIAKQDVWASVPPEDGQYQAYSSRECESMLLLGEWISIQSDLYLHLSYLIASHVWYILQ